VGIKVECVQMVVRFQWIVLAMARLLNSDSVWAMHMFDI
jgi:hypothetical protein